MEYGTAKKIKTATKNDTVIDLLDADDDEAVVFMSSSSASKKSHVKVVCLRPTNRAAKLLVDALPMNTA